MHERISIVRSVFHSTLGVSDNEITTYPSLISVDSQTWSELKATIDPRYSQYLENILQELLKDGYQIRTNVRSQSLTLQILAYSGGLDSPQNPIYEAYGALPMQVIFAFMFAAESSPELLLRYVEAIRGLSPQLGHGRMYRVPIPFLVSTRFQEDIKGFIAGYSPVKDEYKMTFIDHPLLVELESKQIFHHQGAGFVAMRPKRFALKIVQKYLPFDQPAHQNNVR